MPADELTVITSNPLVAPDWGLGERPLTGYSSLSFTRNTEQGLASASLGWSASPTEIDGWLRYGLGRHVAIYGPSHNLLWEGCVNGVNVTYGSANYSVGPLTDIANRVVVVYSPVDITADPPATGPARETTALEDEESQARYGVWDKVYSAGSCYDGGTPSLPVQIQRVILRDQAYPRTTQSLALPGQSAQITLDCQGYWMWLQAYLFNDVASVTVTVTDRVLQLLTPVGSGGPDPNGLFSTDYSQIDTNNTLVAPKERDNKTAWEVMKTLIASSDGTNFYRWTFGIGPGRRAYYHSQPTTPEYAMALADQKLRLTRYLGDDTVPYWGVQAGQWVFVSDILTGTPWPSTVADMRADPRFLFIESTTYTTPDGLQINGSPLDRLPQLLARRMLGGM